MDKNSIDTQLADASTGECRLRIKLIGVGGAGGNAIDRLKLDRLDQINLAAVNTDAQALGASPVGEKLLIGRTITRGISAGGEPDIGRQCAEADRAALQAMVGGIHLVFILAGLGGGTGSGAAPVLAQVATDAGALVIAFVTMPFSNEGARRNKVADDALAELRRTCHAVIPLPNDLLLQQIDKDASIMEAFAIADQWIHQGVSSIWSMLFQTGLMNVDFATLRRAFVHRGGKTLFGTGYAKGPDYLQRAIQDLELCPLLHLPENKYVRRTDSLIVNVVGGPDLTMSQVQAVIDYVTEKFGKRDNLVLGAVIDGAMAQSLRITVIGGTDVAGAAKQHKPAPSASIPANVSPAASRKAEAGARFPEGRRRRARDLQDEFDFPDACEQRGYFEKTASNICDGEDLDIPTYFRRGVRIALH